MYHANCEWYVDMGEHNKPLCKRKSLRPAKCSECPVYIRNIEEENAKLREQIHWLKQGDILHVLTDQEYIDQCEHERLMQASIDTLDKDNAKLRELTRDMWPSYCYANGGNGETYLAYEQDVAIRDRMRKMGVFDE